MAKILVSVLGSDPAVQGSGTVAVAYRAFQILREAYDTTLLIRSDRKEHGEGVVTVTPANTRLWNLKIIPIIRHLKPDCVYCVSDLAGFVSYYLLSHIYNFSIVFEATTLFRYKYSPIIKWPFAQWEALVARFSDYVIAESEFIYDRYRRFTNKITLIPLFVDEELFISRKDARREKDLDVKRIGIIGPFVASTNLPSIRYLYRNLKGLDERLQFVLVGKCNMNFSDPRIDCLGHIPSFEGYANVLKSLDALVVLPKRFGDPGPYTKILEGMACGLPVFTTVAAVSGIDLARSGKEILIFEDEDELTRGINELIFDNELMEEIGRNARWFVERYHSKRVNASIMMSIFRKLLQER